MYIVDLLYSFYVLYCSISVQFMLCSLYIVQ